MAVRHSRVAVGTSATNLLVVDDRHGKHLDVSRTVVIQNSSDVAVHLGGSGVTTTTSGYVISAGGEVSLDLIPDDRLYAVAEAATTVNVLHLGV